MVVATTTAPTPADRPAISVILCTYNPRPDLFAEVLAALARQTLPPTDWELLIIDNNSNPPVTLALTPDPQSASAAGVPPTSPSLPIRVIPEPTPGLNHARRTGILHARADLFLFVDDDNILDPDYLEIALSLPRSHPQLGAFGGLTRPRLERPNLPRWKFRLLDRLGVRDHGPSPLTSSADKWGPWVPVGAGLVLRRAVAQHFVLLMDTTPYAQRLDRAGPTGLMSGGDALMARSAYRVGLACSYQPALKLTHVINSSRLDTKYLLRILYSHGKSVVVLNRALNAPVSRMILPSLLVRFPYRLLTRGLRGGLVLYAWDLGYYLESHRRPLAQDRLCFHRS